MAAVVWIAIAATAHATQLVKVGTFSQPTYVAAPSGDGSRLFVVQKTGKIALLANGRTQAAPFLDLSGKVQASDTSEQGLLSMAFAP